MKQKLLFITGMICFISFSHAQMYERGRKNFFITTGGDLTFTNEHKKAWTGNNKGYSAHIGAGKIFTDIFQLGLNYYYTNNNYKLADTSGALVSSAYTYQTASINANLLLPVIYSSTGKSKRYECTGLTHYLILGPEYLYRFGADGANNFTTRGGVALNMGWGFLYKKSGGRKFQQGNDIYVNLNVKKVFGQFGSIQYEGSTRSLYNTFWGVNILWVKYRTGRWL